MSELSPNTKKRLRLIFKVLGILTAVVTFLLFFNIVVYNMPIKGQVIDASTNKPIPGAIVIVLWRSGTFYASRTQCYHVETTTTDEQGYYVISGWVKVPGNNFIKSKRPVGPDVFKPGYKHAGQSEKNKVFLEPFVGTREEQLAYLSRKVGGTSCSTHDESEKNLILLRRALYEEAKRLAKTEEDEGYVRYQLRSLEDLTYGYKVARDREDERYEAERLKRNGPPRAGVEVLSP